MYLDVCCLVSAGGADIHGDVGCELRPGVRCQQQTREQQQVPHAGPHCIKYHFCHIETVIHISRPQSHAIASTDNQLNFLVESGRGLVYLFIYLLVFFLYCCIYQLTVLHVVVLIYYYRENKNS